MIKNKNLKNVIITVLLITTLFIIVFTLQGSFAANQTISDTQSIDQGIIDTEDKGTLTLNKGTYDKEGDRGIYIRKNITIRGNGSPETVTIDAKGQSGIFYSYNDNMVLKFENLTFKNATGAAISNGYSNTTLTFINCIFINNTNGRAIFNGGVNMAVTNCNFTNNNGAGYGGAIENYGNNMQVTGCNFINNTGGGNGGAISHRAYGNMSVINCSFINNTSFDNYAGAIQIHQGDTIIIEGCNFTNNNARFAGAMSIGYTITSITNCNFINNHAEEGGAIHCGPEVLSINNCNFTNNNAEWRGGAFYGSGDNTNIIGCNFINNYANTSTGGAIYYYGDNTNIIGCNFINNYAKSGDAGAIYYYGDNTNLIGCNFTNNTAKCDGGAIYIGACDSSITSCNFINNTGEYGGAIYNEGYNISVIGSNFITNIATQYGGGIFNNMWADMLVSGNTMIGNSAVVSGNVIYNYGYMGVLNLTYLDNSTLKTQIRSPVTLYATLTDDMGNPITGQYISFFVNGNYQGDDIANEGRASVTYTPTKLGIVSVDGNYYYNEDLSIIRLQGQLEVINGTAKNNTNSTIVISPSNPTVGTTVTISGILTNYSGVSQVNVTVDGKVNLVTVNSTGGWSLSYITNRDGNIPVVVSLTGHSNYNNFKNSINFNVISNIIPKTNSNIVIFVVPTAVIGQTVVVKATLKDSSGKAISGQNIDLTIAGKTVTLSTNSDGQVSTNYFVTMLGMKTIEAKFAGNNVYESSSQQTNFDVVKPSTNIALTVTSSAYYGQTVVVKGVLTDQLGNVLSGKTVNLNVAGVIVNRVTDSKGEFSYSYLANKLIASNSIVASFAGDNQFITSSRTSPFKVVKATTSLTITKFAPKFKKSNVIKYTLKGQNGKVIAGKTINFFVNGKSVATAKSNSVGVVSFKYTFKTKKTHNILAKFGGDSLYLAKNSATFKAIPK